MYKKFGNNNEGWKSSICVEASEVTGFHLFFKCDISYAEDGKFVKFDNRVEHFENIYRNILGYCGIEGIFNDQHA